MLFSKYMPLDVVSINNRKITPIAEISGFVVGSDYILFDFSVVAFIVDENNEKYYVNISLSENRLIKLKDNTLFN